MKKGWQNFTEGHPGLARFVIFFLVSNGVTILQLLLMPILRTVFESSAAEGIEFKFLQVGQNPDGSPFYVFNYAAGPITETGAGGGLAYFLSVQISIGIAQVVNFFAQRNITFKSNSSIAKAAAWYFIAYVIITVLAGAAQGLYKAPIYAFLISRFGAAGETGADIITMLINAAISFWVFYPIFAKIFKTKTT